MSQVDRIISSIDQNEPTKNLIRKWEEGKGPSPFRNCALNSVNQCNISKYLSRSVYVGIQLETRFLSELNY